MEIVAGAWDFERINPDGSARRVEVLWDASRQLRTFNREKTGAGRA